MSPSQEGLAACPGGGAEREMQRPGPGAPSSFCPPACLMDGRGVSGESIEASFLLAWLSFCCPSSH